MIGYYICPILSTHLKFTCHQGIEISLYTKCDSTNLVSISAIKILKKILTDGGKANTQDKGFNPVFIPHS